MLAWVFLLACGAGAFPAAVSGYALQQPASASPPSIEPTITEALRLLQQNRSEDALRLFQSAVAQAERLGDELWLAKSLRGVGMALNQQSKYAEMVSAMRRALALFQKLDDAQNEAKCYGDIGLGLYSLGRFDEALPQYELSLEANKRAPTASVEGTTLANIGLVHWRQGRLDDALEYFQKSLAIRRAVGQPGPIGASLTTLGMVSRSRGEYQRALDYYVEALALRRQAGDREGEAQTLNNMGAVHGDFNLPERAIELYQQALTVAEQIGYTSQVALSNENIGANLLALNRPREALTRYEAAISIWRKLDRRGSLAHTLNGSVEVRFQLDDPAGARAAATEALEIARAIGDRDAESRALLNLSAVARRTGDPHAALGHADGALAIAKQVGMPGLEHRALADRGRALQALDRTAAAVEALRASARIVDDLRAHVGSDVAKVGFMDSRQAVFDDLVDVLWQAGQREEALEAAEAGRARAFADLLMQRQVLRQRTDSGRALESLRVAVGDKERASARAPSSAGGGDADLLRKRADADVGRALDALRSVDAELASLVSADSPRVPEIRRLASDRRVTFVEYLVGERRLFIWVIAPDGTLTATTVPAPRARVDKFVAELRRSIEGADLDALSHPDRLTATTTELDALLIQPIKASLPASPASTIVVIPSGSLALLPFAALTDRENRSLAERHTLAMAPSISLFRYTPAKRAHSNRASRDALIVADPRPPAGSGVTPLPGTREEAKGIAGRLSRATVSVLTGAEASEAAIKRQAGAQSLIHFATHGAVSPARPLASSLILSEGEGEDGYLRVEEVFTLDLRADLVVLSGCSTGLGRLTGDGIFGLSRAFIYAGSPSVVVSQWDVSDRATAFLMERFYAKLAAGLSKAAALRASQLETRRRYRHPALWAAFMLVGEPR